MMKSAALEEGRDEDLAATKMCDAQIGGLTVATIRARRHSGPSDRAGHERSHFREGER